MNWSGLLCARAGGRALAVGTAPFLLSLAACGRFFLSLPALLTQLPEVAPWGYFQGGDQHLRCPALALLQALPGRCPPVVCPLRQAFPRSGTSGRQRLHEATARPMPPSHHGCSSSRDGPGVRPHLHTHRHPPGPADIALPFSPPRRPSPTALLSLGFCRGTGRPFSLAGPQEREYLTAY